jgi:hypothetical protein
MTPESKVLFLSITISLIQSIFTLNQNDIKEKVAIENNPTRKKKQR